MEWDLRPSFNSAVDPSTGLAIPEGWAILTVPPTGNPRDLRSYVIPDVPPSGLGSRFPLNDSVAGLEEGKRYYVRVFAYNAAQRYSAPALTFPETEIASGLPDAPADVLASALDAAGPSVRLSWLRPDSNGDSIDSYVVQQYTRNTVEPHVGRTEVQTVTI